MLRKLNSAIQGVFAVEWMIRLLCDKKSELESEIRTLNKDINGLMNSRDDKVNHVKELDTTLKSIRA